MLTLLRVLLLLALCCPAFAQGRTALFRLPRARVTFVAPVMGSDGNVATRSTGGSDHLVFEEVAPGADRATDRVRAHLEASPAWDLVCRLYGYSWQRLRGAGVSGSEGGPGRSPGSVSESGSHTAGDLVLAVTNAFGDVGPSHAGHAVVARRRDGREVQVSSFIILADTHAPSSDTGGPDLTLEVLMKSEYLALALAHECGHQVMWDAYGPAGFPRAASLSRSGHDVHRITDPHLAFSEGWAEAFAAVVGDLSAADGRGPRADSPALELLVQRRHQLVERDRYIYADHAKKTGRMKSGLQLVSTEGVVAFLVYQSYANRIFAREQGQPEAYGAVLDTLKRHRPRELVAFWNASMQDLPALKDKLVRIFLEGTRYGTVSPAAAAKYFEMWRTQQAAQKLPRGHPGRQDAERDAHAIEQAWTAWKEQAYTAAVRSGRVDSALPPSLDPLWLDHGMRRVGLNLATADELSEFRAAVLGPREDHLLRAGEWLARRDDAAGPGYFSGLDALSTLASPEEMSSFRAARKEFEVARAGAAEPVPVAAYLSHRGSHASHARLARMLSGR